MAKKKSAPRASKRPQAPRSTNDSSAPSTPSPAAEVVVAAAADPVVPEAPAEPVASPVDAPAPGVAASLAADVAEPPAAEAAPPVAASQAVEPLPAAAEAPAEAPAARVAAPARAAEPRSPGTSRRSSAPAPRRRAVIVGGMRTPFVKAFGELMQLDSIALSTRAVGALLDKWSLPRREIDAIVWGGVIFPPGAPNLAREIALDLQLPASVEGMTVTRACASGLQAVTLAAAAIERGEADVVLAGGSDSTSNAPLSFPAKVTHALAPLALGKGATASDLLGALAQLRPFGESIPQKPRIAERTTGEVMGESAEHMARRNEISRRAQDEFAVRSHLRAARAIESGRFASEVVPVQAPDGKWVHTDRLVRGDTSFDKLARLRPVFAADGTVTAGNASPLTDGAAAVLLMSEEKARALGYTPLAAFRSWSYVGVDPADQLLIGPALAMPKALERAGVALSDIDLVDMHEAFAAQVLSVLKLLASASFARQRLGRDQAVGEIGPDRLNIHGGSLAIGHPFGATGARMVTTMANELHARGKGLALLGICAAGGLGAGAVLEAC